MAGPAGDVARETYGCEKPVEQPHRDFEELTFDRCFAFYVKDKAFLSRALEYHAFADKGFLPYPGTPEDQPNKVIETLLYIDRLIGVLNVQAVRNRATAK